MHLKKSTRSTEIRGRREKSSMISVVCLCVTAIMLLWTVYNLGKIHGVKEGMKICKDAAKYTESQIKIRKEFKK